eukprot:8309125-Alexandrium_andersonii.AAC.1
METDAPTAMLAIRNVAEQHESTPAHLNRNAMACRSRTSSRTNANAPHQETANHSGSWGT